MKNESLHDCCIQAYEDEEKQHKKVLTKEEAFELFAEIHAMCYADRRRYIIPEVRCGIALIVMLISLPFTCWFSKILIQWVINKGIIIL